MTTASQNYKDFLHVAASMTAEQQISFFTFVLKEKEMSMFDRREVECTLTDLRKQREQHARYKLGPQYGTGR